LFTGGILSSVDQRLQRHTPALVWVDSNVDEIDLKKRKILLRGGEKESRGLGCLEETGDSKIKRGRGEQFGMVLLRSTLDASSCGGGGGAGKAP